MSTTAEYIFLRTDKELRQLAEEMRKFAEQNPLDKHQVETLVINEPGEREKIGPMVRIHGKEAGTLAKRYSRFVCFSTKDPRPLQISYMVYTSELNGRLRQLTVSNNIKQALLIGEVSRIAYFFMKPNTPVHSVETPEHVALMIQEDNDV